MSHDPNAPAAPTPSTAPQLTPQFCLNTTALRDFLRISRASVDDSVSLHLNSLLQPSRRPVVISPSTVSPPSNSSSPGARTRRQIPGNVCSHFRDAILFPSWADREAALTYCTDVATRTEASEGSIDSGSWGEKPVMHMPSDKMNSNVLSSPSPSSRNSDDAILDGNSASLDPYTTQRPRTFYGQEQVTNERKDPYSGRDYSYTHVGRAAALRATLDNERGVERIVRARTWSLLAERCLDDGSAGYAADEGYERDWRQWNEEHGRSR